MHHNNQSSDIILEDGGWPGRGFFSSVNLSLVAILWCQQKGLNPSIGNSILRLYSHPFTRNAFRRRPYSSFFGNSWLPSKKCEELDIGDIWLSTIENIDINSESIINKLFAINTSLQARMPGDISNYTNAKPENWPTHYDVAIHYRGCDYLKNTPKDHVPNLAPEPFIEQILPLISNKNNIFVATDDSSFLRCLRKRNIKFYAFNDVNRAGPGKGSHIKNRLQRAGIEPLKAPFFRGLKVLRDCTHLSKATHYIGSNSNLMYYSRVLNPRIIVNNLSINQTLCKP